MNETQYDFERERAAAWANIKDSNRTGSVLTAQAIGIEYFQLGAVREECLKLNYNGIYGYLPISFIDNYEFKGLQNFIGKVFEFVVSYVDLEEQIFAADRIKALELLAKRFWKNAKVGNTYTAFVRGVDKFNVYLLVNGVPTKMHRNEFSYTFYEDLREEVFIGEELEVKLMEIQKPQPNLETEGDEPTEEEKKQMEGYISVSSKALEVDPMTFINEYQVKSTYLGVITKIHLDHGLFIRLEPRGILARTGFPPQADAALFKEGQKVNFKIQDIDAHQRRVKGIVITPRQSAGKRNTRSLNYVR